MRVGVGAEAEQCSKCIRLLEGNEQWGMALSPLVVDVGAGLAEDLNHFRPPVNGREKERCVMIS